MLQGPEPGDDIIAQRGERAPPPWLPPSWVVTTGAPNSRFSSSTSSQARRYDMPSARPAAEIEPLRSISSSSAILPGPIRPCGRGRREERCEPCTEHARRRTNTRRGPSPPSRSTQLESAAGKSAPSVTWAQASKSRRNSSSFARAPGLPTGGRACILTDETPHGFSCREAPQRGRRGFHHLRSGLAKTYASGFQALKNIDLEIRRGEIFALLGPNGAGKTTLISIICGIVNPSDGTVTVDGHDIVSDYRAARSKIGLVPQELTTDMFETVWATVTFSRGLFGKPPNPAHIEKVLRELSLWDKKDSKIMTLSGGMKRRVMIAKALSHEPQILFLDEPTAGVDVELRRDMWAMVRALRDTRRHDHPDHALHRGGRADGRPHRRDQQGRDHPGRGQGRADAASSAGSS